MVRYTEPSGKLPLETVWKRDVHSQKIVCRWSDKTIVYRHSSRGKLQTITSTVGEQYHLWSQLAHQNLAEEDRKHLFHQEKPSVPFFALRSMKNTLHFWWNWCSSNINADLFNHRRCCFQMKNHFPHWSSHLKNMPPAAKSSSCDYDLFKPPWVQPQKHSLRPGKTDPRDHRIIWPRQSSCLVRWARTRAPEIATPPLQVLNKFIQVHGQ